MENPSLLRFLQSSVDLVDGELLKSSRSRAFALWDSHMQRVSYFLIFSLLFSPMDFRRVSANHKKKIARINYSLLPVGWSVRGRWWEPENTHSGNKTESLNGRSWGPGLRDQRSRHRRWGCGSFRTELERYRKYGGRGLPGLTTNSIFSVSFL